MFSVAVATHLFAVAVPILQSFRNLLFVELINYLEQKDFFKKKSASQRAGGQRFWEKAYKHFLITELHKVCGFHVWGRWLHMFDASAVLGDMISGIDRQIFEGRIWDDLGDRTRHTNKPPSLLCQNKNMREKEYSPWQ